MGFFYVYGENGEKIAVRNLETDEIYFKENMNDSEWLFFQKMVSWTEEMKKRQAEEKLLEDLKKLMDEGDDR